MSHVKLLNGLRIAYQEWGSPQSTKRVLALHGWLDNSNSFKTLGPFLAERGFHVVAMDHLGHGRSDHLGAGGLYSILHSVAVAREFTTALGWNSDSQESVPSGGGGGAGRQFDLLGHSMGGIISTIYSATFPENVRRLVLVEALGPLSERDVDNTPKNLRRAVEAGYSIKLRTAGSGAVVGKRYATVGEAVRARVRTVSKYPGRQSLSDQAAQWIVARAVLRTNSAAAEEVEATNGPELADVDSDSAGPVRFVHDQRLLLPSLIYHTPEQVCAVLCYSMSHDHSSCLALLRLFEWS
jgi:pimeloyl-ACP methyl ester carboxylesterase